METGEVGAHMAAVAKPVEEGLIRDLEVAITQVQRMEDGPALDLLNRLRLAIPMHVLVWLLICSNSIRRPQFLFGTVNIFEIFISYINRNGQEML